MASSLLSFKVQRKETKLIAPAKPTPQEVKYLSDIDSQQGLRTLSSGIEFYKRNERMEGKDPVKVIRGALAKTLVTFYPFAGRLREGSDGKLMVDCNGQGVLFIEADADVSLDTFGDLLHPPFPGFEELLYDVPGFSALLNSPLMLVQVTRLICGGFIFAIRLQHAMSDAYGSALFLKTLAKTARGATVLSVEPVWKRQLLNARESPQVSYMHREYDAILDTKPSMSMVSPLDNNMVERSFFFSPKVALVLKNHVSPRLRKCSSFEILTAYLWRCRTIALGIEPDEEVRVVLSVNTRSKFNSPLPVGYYGNAVAFPAAVSTAGKLCNNPVEYALELIMEAKQSVTEDYMKSVADLMVVRGHPTFSLVGGFLVSDLTHTGFDGNDFGWGGAVYSGPGNHVTPGTLKFYLPMRSKNCVHGTVVPLALPKHVMERFVVELHTMIC